jgi:carbamoyltransferase
MAFNLSFYTGHNAAFTISEDNRILEVVELERFLNVKNVGLLWYSPAAHNPLKVIDEILNYFKRRYSASEYDTIICNYGDAHTLKRYSDIFERFRAKNLVEFYHQEAHAYNAFYQSNYNDATIITCDGGGDDGCFSYYKGNRENGLSLIRREYEYNLGEKYAQFGFSCDSLSPEDQYQGYLVYAGKLMGLSAYGQILEDKLPLFFDYYKGHHNGFDGKAANFKTLQLPDRLNGQLELDVVRTSQYVFEKIFQRIAAKEIAESDNRLCLTGGCALNVLNNTAIHQTTKTHVTPNTDDRGLSLGFMLGFLKPKTAFDSTYIGPEVWDRDLLHEYVNQYKGLPVNISALADDIRDGKIVGVVRGRSEHGARALGNRSILCNPGPGMKDILNAKVKHREYYRPFAPVVRLEDVNKYFYWNEPARHMTYSPMVRDEWRHWLESVVHVDGTARVQTVTREENEFLYDLLTEVHNKTGIGVIINTSFNLAGKPILNSYRDAVWMLTNTQMDSLVLEDYHIKRQ